MTEDTTNSHDQHDQHDPNDRSDRDDIDRIVDRPMGGPVPPPSANTQPPLELLNVPPTAGRNADADEAQVFDSPVLRTVARFASPLTILVSLVIFWQGHNLPGGGFIAGVMAAAAGAMWLMGFGPARAARIAWWRLAVGGLLIALLTGTVSLFVGEPFMFHTIFHVPFIGHLPSAVFFDVGVYLIVFGSLMTIFVELAVEEH